MPKYRHDIRDTLFDEDVRKIFNRTKNEYERVLVSLCWLTGARPAEIIDIHKEDINFDENQIAIRIRSLKRGNDGTFDTMKRILILPRPSGTDALTDPSFKYIETVINYVKGLPPESKLIPYTKRWAQLAVSRMGMEALEKPISIYHFRHSVMTRLAEAGMTTRDIKYYKGAKDERSVSSYDHARPQVIQPQHMRRSKAVQVFKE